jgi:hypothetical protein
VDTVGSGLGPVAGSGATELSTGEKNVSRKGVAKNKFWKQLERLHYLTAKCKI